MKMNKKFVWFTYFALVMLVGFPKAAFAYVDPATLTYVIQIVAGLFIAGGVAIGVYWRKIKKIFSKDKNAASDKPVSAEDRSAAANAAAAAAAAMDEITEEVKAEEK